MSNHPLIETIKRAFWATTWRLMALGVVALAIALNWAPAQRVSATDAVQHPLASTQLTSLAPVVFGQPIPPSGEISSEQPASDSREMASEFQSTEAQVGALRQYRERSAADLHAGEAPTPTYTPREEIVPAHPSNYGPRYLTDIYGNSVDNAPIVVIHETVGTANSAINLFQRNHPRDADQVSYHSLIKRDGTIVHLVHPQMRAFGAGNSVFEGANGAETVRTNPDFPPSVNNFAYHTSLESPSDGWGNQSSHSGYTVAQYQSLAWLVARLPVPNERITTHRIVDRSGSRRDPRSFDMRRFLGLLRAYPRNARGHLLSAPEVAILPRPADMQD